MGGLGTWSEGLTTLLPGLSYLSIKPSVSAEQTFFTDYRTRVLDSVQWTVFLLSNLVSRNSSS